MHTPSHRGRCGGLDPQAHRGAHLSLSVSSPGPQNTHGPGTQRDTQGQVCTEVCPRGLHTAVEPRHAQPREEPLASPAPERPPGHAQPLPRQVSGTKGGRSQPAPGVLGCLGAPWLYRHSAPSPPLLSRGSLFCVRLSLPLIRASDVGPGAVLLQCDLILA